MAPAGTLTALAPPAWTIRAPSTTMVPFSITRAVADDDPGAFVGGDLRLRRDGKSGKNTDGNGRRRGYVHLDA